MAGISDHNRADETEQLMKVLLSGPTDGLTVDKIHEATQWGDSRINHRLLDLGSLVGHHKIKRADNASRTKVTHYFLKVR